MARAVPKRKTKRNANYLDWIRTLSCSRCNTVGPCEAAHVRINGDGGTSLKPSDYRAVPLCHHCHQLQHNNGERTFWAMLADHPNVVIMKLLRRYIDDDKKVIDSLSDIIENAK